MSTPNSEPIAIFYQETTDDLLLWDKGDKLSIGLDNGDDNATLCPEQARALIRDLEHFLIGKPETP